jgi:hypothetical protein
VGSAGGHGGVRVCGGGGALGAGVGPGRPEARSEDGAARADRPATAVFRPSPAR